MLPRRWWLLLPSLLQYLVRYTVARLRNTVLRAYVYATLCAYGVASSVLHDYEPWTHLL